MHLQIKMFLGEHGVLAVVMSNTFCRVVYRVSKDHETSQAGSRGFGSGVRASGKICQGFSMESQGISQETFCFFVMLKHPTMSQIPNISYRSQ